MGKQQRIKPQLVKGMRDQLGAPILRRQEMLDPEPISRMLAEHREGRDDHGRRLWPLFILQRWHERWLEGTPAAPESTCT